MRRKGIWCTILVIGCSTGDSTAVRAAERGLSGRMERRMAYRPIGGNSNGNTAGRQGSTANSVPWDAGKAAWFRVGPECVPRYSVSVFVDIRRHKMGAAYKEDARELDAVSSAKSGKESLYSRETFFWMRSTGNTMSRSVRCRRDSDFAPCRRASATPGSFPSRSSRGTFGNHPGIWIQSCSRYFTRPEGPGLSPFDVDSPCLKAGVLRRI